MDGVGTKTSFINEALDNAITKYLKTKNSGYPIDFEDFYMVIIRQLVNIYGELDVINPYLTGNENGLSGFRANLTKFGYKNEQYDKFVDNVQKYLEKENENSKGFYLAKNEYFVFIQEDLIDMMIAKMKYMTVSDEETGNFVSLLYTPNSNPSFALTNLAKAPDENSVLNYWKNALFRKDNDFTLKEIKQNVLGPRVYESLGWKLENVLDMSQKGINDLNTEAFKKFEINYEEENAIDKLNAAVERFLNPPAPMTSGNGFVDGLLLVSIITTLCTLAFALSVFFLK